MPLLNALNHIAGALAGTPNAQVVIAYDSFSSGVRAKRFFDQHFAPSDPAGKYRCQMWDFAGLRPDCVRARAVRDALESDIVCLAVSSHDSLPEAVKAWAERWAQERGPRFCLMVLLLESPQTNAGGDRQLIQFLRNVAAKANADFLIAPLDSFDQKPHVLEPIHDL